MKYTVRGKSGKRCTFWTIGALLGSLFLSTLARVGGREEFHGKSVNDLPAAYACVIKNVLSGLYAVDRKTGQILRGITTIKGPTRLEIHSDGLFYKKDNPCAYSAFNRVYFTILGPLKDNFSGTFPSADAPILLERLVKKPPFKIVWDTPQFSNKNPVTFIIFASPRKLSIAPSEVTDFYTSFNFINNLLLQIEFPEKKVKK